MGSLLVWIILKSNDLQCSLFNGNEGEMGVGVTPTTNFWNRAFLEPTSL